MRKLENITEEDLEKVKKLTIEFKNRIFEEYGETDDTVFWQVAIAVEFAAMNIWAGTPENNDNSLEKALEAIRHRVKEFRNHKKRLDEQENKKSYT